MPRLGRQAHAIPAAPPRAIMLEHCAAELTPQARLAGAGCLGDGSHGSILHTATEQQQGADEKHKTAIPLPGMQNGQTQQTTGPAAAPAVPRAASTSIHPSQTSKLLRRAWSAMERQTQFWPLQLKYSSSARSCWCTACSWRAVRSKMYRAGPCVGPLEVPCRCSARMMLLLPGGSALQLMLLMERWAGK